MPERFAMEPLTLAELLGVLAPGLRVPWAHQIVATEVCIDSRLAAQGSLFVAFKGENADGHDYVLPAFASGATVALIERPVAGVPTVDTLTAMWPAEPPAAVAVRVGSTLQALQALAQARRAARADLRVIGVTGSVGKTTTKEVIADVLEQRYAVLRSTGNLNNEIGLPLTLLTLQRGHCLAVLEMGMYALGEIATLCQIARPQVGVVTAVAPIHLERLGTIERIAQAKAELPQALPSDGVAVLNADDRRVSAMRDLTRARVVTYGESADADVRAVAIQSHGLEGSTFLARAAHSPLWPDRHGERLLRTPLLGRPAVLAALAALAVGLVEGLGWDELEEGLARQRQGLRLVGRPGREGLTLLDDSYNSSPPSALAALELLQGLAGRRVAVLGDMLELGDYEREGHREVGLRAAQACDLLVTVGTRARGIAEAALAAGMPPSAVHALDSNAEAIACLREQLRPGDVVLIKGSRSMRMEQIVQTLEEARP